MTESLSADDAVSICIQVEKNGLAFYRAAAKAADRAGMRALFEELAGMEEDHAGLFEQIRKDLKARKDGALDSRDKDLPLALKSAADSHVFVKGLDGAAAAKKCRTTRDLLEMALRFEKDSVVYFAALHSLVPAGLGGKDISVLVTEELKHITVLNDKIKEIY